MKNVIFAIIYAVLIGGTFVAMYYITDLGYNYSYKVVEPQNKYEVFIVSAKSDYDFEVTRPIEFSTRTEAEEVAQKLADKHSRPFKIEREYRY